MRRILFFVLMVLLSITMMANPVDPDKAIQVARNHVMSQVKMDNYNAMLVYTHPMPKTGEPAFYVVNVGSSAFVLVAADDIAHPVLGYSMSRSWPTGNADGSSASSRDEQIALPSQITAFLDDLASQIEAARQQGIAPDRKIVTEWRIYLSGSFPMLGEGNLQGGGVCQTPSSSLPDSVGPLMTTTWDQGQYYNALCPEDAGSPYNGHVPTGCVATAMAQIINYWGYPLHGRGIHSYQSNYGTLTVNYDSANYDYAHMPNTLTSTSTPQEVQAVATLMRDCGVAANMGYGPSESSSFDVDARAGMINFFRLNPDLSYAEKSFFADSVWENMLRTDIADGRPVMYSGQGDAGGHSFVCDGYKDSNYFHFNFGWGGYANGWYTTTAVNPAGMNFNSSQSAILAIQPDSTGNVILGQMGGTSTFIVDEPLEFYHLLGNNAYSGTNYSNSCNNTVYFISADSANQLVADIIEFEDQNISINDGNGTWLRSLYGGGENDISPVVSSYNALSINYSGNFYYAGFQLAISQDNGCRMVSNIITSIDTTTVHLMWTDNGTNSQWQIEYGVKGFVLGSGTSYTATTNMATFSNLQKFTEYDFYIRPICGIESYGNWSKVTVMVEAAYWQDVVTSQPAGYNYNPSSNIVEISTAEGFAWWAKYPVGSHVFLNSDIDLSEYKWRPTPLGANFHGQGHFISNIYINEPYEDAGLFSECGGIILEDVGLVNAYVKGHSDRTGGLVGRCTWNGSLTIVRNCCVISSIIDGGSLVGGMIGECEHGTVINCYVNANVTGNRWTGLMIGHSWQGTIRNCYSAGSVKIRSYCYNAGIVAYANGGEISNCYSVTTPMGVVGYKGLTNISDTSTFVRSDMGWTLLTPIMFEEQLETNLLIALNNGVEQYNDSSYCIWMADTENFNNGYPVFGNKYAVQCPNVSGVIAQNAQIDNQNAVIVSWNDNQEATQWEIRFCRHDTLTSAYTYITTQDRPDTIFGIPLGHVYDFYVRAICDSGSHSGWSEAYTMIVDLPYWTDIVTTQPVGFVSDSEGNITISSADGLAWFASTVNGFHGIPNTYEGKTITLNADINLEGYRWYPIGRRCYDLSTVFSGTFNGQGHSISNIYVNEAYSYLGLFGYIENGSIKNVNINGGTLSSIYTDSKDQSPTGMSSAAIGGLIGAAYDCHEITNCHSSAIIFANANVGSLCGYIRGEERNTIISNSSASGDIYGRESCGDLIGTVYGNVEVRNCYATGDVRINTGGSTAWHRGGLIGNFMYATAANCYSIGSVTNDSLSYGWYGKVIGSPDMNPHIQYLYGQDNVNEGWELIGNYCENILDTTQFHHSENTNTLLSPVLIEDTLHFELLNALNAWVSFQNDPTLKTWVIDSITGYPIFGDEFVPSCYNPTNLDVTQATFVGDTIIRTQLSWTQLGEPNHWEILYVAAGHSIDSGVIVSVNSNPYIFTDIPVSHPLDFYVRAVCNDNDVSGWSTPITYIPDKLRWTEVVTSQPAGYTEDIDGNIYISSAEGLAWLSSVANGLNGEQFDEYHFYGKQIVLTTDINLGDYRWTAIGNMSHRFNGASFNGNNHAITGLYCNEMSDDQGLFGCFFNGIVKNLVLKQCSVLGQANVAIVVGSAYNVNIVNCSAEGSVCGIESIGGIVGLQSGGNITNDCYRGTVSERRDITRANTIIGLIGGICGTSWGIITNSYVDCVIPLTAELPGIITGTSGNPSMVSNCYYKNHYQNIPLSGDCTMENNSSFSGSGNIWTLDTPPFVNGSFRTDLVEALNAWVDANNTEGQYRHWVADTTMVNGGFPVFATISCTPTTRNDSITVCDNFTWHGTVYTTNATLIDTLSTLEGCDSVVTLHLTINYSSTGDTTAMACDNFTWWNTNYTNSTNNATHTFTNAVGCDSVVTLHLTINYSSTGDTTAMACDNFTWWNTDYTNSTNNATHTFTNAVGCDSIITLHLTINNPVHTATTHAACESYSWNNTNYTASGNYTYSHSDANGCTQVDTLHLTINNPVYTATTETACETYTWNNTAYTTSGNYTYTYLNANGCIQVDTLHLTINYSTAGDTSATACENFTWHGTTYTESTQNSIFTIQNSYGCDSVVTLHLTINNPIHSATIETACESYIWNNTAYTTSGNYTFSQFDANGCTQVDTLHLTINNPVHIATTETTCDSYIWNNTTYTTSGNYTFSHLDVNGCTQVDTLHLTINYSTTGDTTATACENFTWHGTIYTESTQNSIFTIQNSYGCDSVVTLHLTINNPVHTATTEKACESFTWNNTNYTASGNYTYSHTDVNGCTQVDTLLLTINTPVVKDVYDTACESYTWFGTTYTTTGDYVRTWTSALPGGCDTTETLHLTINHSVTIFDTLSLLSNELPYNYHGNTINSEGDYTFNGTTIEGCDSTVILYVTVTPVGIFDIQNSEFKTDVFPNPTNGVVTIASEEVTQVEVMDASGRKVLTVENSNRIDLSNMPSGVYMLQITTLQGKALKRVIRK